MTKRRLTRDELQAHRNEHLEFLQASCTAFDSGALGEAKRLAVSLRVLLHQTAKSDAILAQLGERTGIWLAYSHAYDPDNVLVHQGLIRLHFRPGMATSDLYQAKLADAPSGPRAVNFRTWWESDIVLSDTSRRTFTRKELVLFSANKDGGAHVDSELDSTYAALKDGTGSGWIFRSQLGDLPVPNVMAHSVRQIAFEVLRHYQKA